jgi:transposase
MSFRFREGHRIFVYSDYVDMRAGFQRLSFYVREKMNHDLLQGDLFIFVGKSRRLLKGICYDGTGLMLIGKRLEEGKFMKLESLEESCLSQDELDLLLRGSVIRRQKFGNFALTDSGESL